jgi:hypothetical protein
MLTLSVIKVMELDLIRKEADTLGLTSRADGYRSARLFYFLNAVNY